jgi:hypothetical protein
MKRRQRVSYLLHMLKDYLIFLLFKYLKIFFSLILPAGQYSDIKFLILYIITNFC